MMMRNSNTKKDQFKVIAIDQLVPQDHLIRKIESVIDFSFIYPLVEILYSTVGCPGIEIVHTRHPPHF